MFCPNCGNNLPDNAAFCGNCGTALKAAQPQQPQQTQQQYYAQPNQAQQQYYAQPNQAFAAPYTGAVKIGALVMTAVLAIFSILSIVLWFSNALSLSIWGETTNFTWAEVYDGYSDEDIMTVFRVIAVIFLAINIILCAVPIVNGNISKKRVRFITSRFVSIVNLIVFFIHYGIAVDARSSCNMTFGSVMFIISCVVLFVLPFFISHATKPAAPAYQAYQQPYQTPYQQY